MKALSHVVRRPVGTAAILAISLSAAPSFAQSLSVELLVLNPENGSGEVEVVSGDAIEVQFRISDPLGETAKGDKIRIRRTDTDEVVKHKKRGALLEGTVSLDTNKGAAIGPLVVEYALAGSDQVVAQGDKPVTVLEEPTLTEIVNRLSLLEASDPVPGPQGPAGDPGPPGAPGPAGPQGPPGALPWTDVRTYGATGDGATDDTAAIQNAIDSSSDGDTLYFPAGRYRVSAALLVHKRIDIRGDGYGSQIFQAGDHSLFVLEKPCSLCFRPAGISMRDLYLGSAATAPGTALIELVNAANNHFENITLLGSHTGVYLKGSLLNTFVSLRSAVNVGGFFAGASTSFNQFWVLGERFDGISANANTFVAPSLEGGTNGIRIEDSNGEGSVYVYGGTIEGLTGSGVHLQTTGLPSVISGTHFEGNGLSDVTVDGAAHVSLSSVFSTRGLDVVNGARNTVIDNALVDVINIAPSAVRTVVRSTEVSISGAGGISNGASDSVLIGLSGVNGFDWFGTVGIGTTNPNSNPVGLTPHLKLDVEGNVRANAFLTGDIKFHKDGKLVWRLFEDEQGLYLEETATGRVDSLPMARDLRRLEALIRGQQETIDRLEAQLAGIGRRK